MISLLLAFTLAACDDDTGPIVSKEPKAEGAAKPADKQPPPTALTGVRFGGAFARTCWYDFTEEQRTALTSAATAGAATESSAQTALAAALPRDDRPDIGTAPGMAEKKQARKLQYSGD